MSWLSSSHFRKKAMKNEAESHDSCNSASNGLSGTINFTQLAGDIRFLDNSDTDSEEEIMLASKPTEPPLRASAVTTTTEKRTVGFGPPKCADATASETRQLGGTSVLDRSATFTDGTHVLSSRNEVRFSTRSAATRWPNPTQAKARLIELVQMLGGSVQLVSFQAVQLAYYSRYGDPLDKKEVQRLFGTQPTLKALREHCHDAFEISERSGLIELRMRNEGSSSSSSTFSSVPSDPLPSVTSARPNFRPITVTVAPLTNISRSAGASKVPAGRLSTERPEIHPTNGANRSFVPLSSRPATMQSYLRPTSSFSVSAQPCSATLATPPPTGSNRVTSAINPIYGGSTMLPSQTFASACKPVLTQKKKPLPGYTSRGDGDFTESDSDEESEHSGPPPLSDHASNRVDASRAHPNVGDVSTSNGTVVASEGRELLTPANTQVSAAVAAGQQQSKSIFARCPSPGVPKFIPKTAAVRNVASSVPRFNWDQREAMLQPNVAWRGQTDSVPAVARNGAASNAHCTNGDADSTGRKATATGRDSDGHGSRASSRLSTRDDKLQSMREMVFAMVKFRHPARTPLTDVVLLLEQASSNGSDMRDVLGMGTWEFVKTIAGLKVYEERGLIFCAVDTEGSDH